jgi:hypothetical protein
MDIVDTTNFRVRKQVRVLRSIGGAPLQWGNGPRRTRPMLGVELPGMLRDELGVPVTVDLCNPMADALCLVLCAMQLATRRIVGDRTMISPWRISLHSWRGHMTMGCALLPEAARLYCVGTLCTGV